jgi:hypothetical protein
MSPSSARRLARVSLLVIAAASAPILMSTAAEAVGPLGSCSATQAGTTITLTADCTTIATINVADGVTVDGDGYTITAVDPLAGNFSGPVLKSAAGSPSAPATLNVKDLGVVASLAPNVAVSSLSGLFYDDAGGTITNVSLSGITTSATSGAGRALEVRNAAATAAPTLAINGLRVRNYNKSGVFIQGKTSFTATNLDIGPATGVDGSQWVDSAANGFTVLDGPTGTLTNSKIAGNRYATDDNDPNAPQGIGTAILSIESPSLTISDVTVSGTDSDIGLIVQKDDPATTSKVSITCSTLTRTAGGHADSKYGVGISEDVDPGDGAVTLTAGSNTLSGWAANSDGTITSTIDPACTPPTKATVAATAKKDEVKAGKKIKITGTAFPALAGVPVNLQLKKHGEFKTVSTTTLPANGAFKFVRKARADKHTQRYRVVVGTGTLYAGGTSNTVRVHVRS